jgi:hypothetical protein
VLAAYINPNENRPQHIAGRLRTHLTGM